MASPLERRLRFSDMNEKRLSTGHLNTQMISMMKNHQVSKKNLQ